MTLRVDKPEALLALERERLRLGVAEGDCLMCALERGSRPAPIVETEDAVVLLDRFGSRRGHLLVIAKGHVEDLLLLGAARYGRIQQLCFEASQALTQVLSPTRLFVAALGAPRAAPMSFPHYHVHVLPLFECDESTRPARVFSWTDGVVLYSDEDADELSAQLRRAWPNQRSSQQVKVELELEGAA